MARPNSFAILILLAFLQLSGQAEATPTCREITTDRLQSTTLNPTDFPVELKINTSFLNFLQTHLPKEQLHSLARLLQVDARLEQHVVMNLHRSISLHEDSLSPPPQDQRLPSFDIHNIRLLRAYSVLKTMAEATAISEVSPTVLLSEAEIQTWALMLADYVPAEFPERQTFKLRGFDSLVLKRLESAFSPSQERYRSALAILFSLGLDVNVSLANVGPVSVTPFTAHQPRPLLSMETPSPTKISALLAKIRYNRPLNQRDFYELQIFVMRLFLISVGKNDAAAFIMRPTSPHSVAVAPLQAAIFERIKPYAPDTVVLIDCLTLFDFLFFGVPLPMNYSEFHNEFLQMIEAQYLAEPRQLWTQQQNDLRLQQQEDVRIAVALRLESLRNDPDARAQVLRPLSSSTLSQSSSPSTSQPKIKTRGVASPALNEPTDEPVANTAVENRIESLIEMRELALHVIAEETPYIVRFQRLEDVYPHDQSFTFSKFVIKWFMKNPAQALDFLSAIRGGPTTVDGQSGIVMLINEEGHPYEVKIQSTGVRWRMILKRDGDSWYGVRIYHRDHMRRRRH